MYIIYNNGIFRVALSRMEIGFFGGGKSNLLQNYSVKKGFFLPNIILETPLTSTIQNETYNTLVAKVTTSGEDVLLNNGWYVNYIGELKELTTVPETKLVATVDGSGYTYSMKDGEAIDFALMPKQGYILSMYGGNKETKIGNYFEADIDFETGKAVITPIIDYGDLEI